MSALLRVWIDMWFASGVAVMIGFIYLMVRGAVWTYKKWQAQYAADLAAAKERQARTPAKAVVHRMGPVVSVKPHIRATLHGPQCPVCNVSARLCARYRDRGDVDLIELHKRPG